MAYNYPANSVGYVFLMTEAPARTGGFLSNEHGPARAEKRGGNKVRGFHDATNARKLWVWTAEK